MVSINWISHSIDDQLPTGRPEDVAVSIDGQDQWTYRQLADTSEAYARGLSARGVTKGDRVGVLLLNSLDYFALYFAIGRIGAIAVRLNWRLAPPELEYAISDSGCRLLCFHTTLAENVDAVREQLGVQDHVAFRLGDADPPVPDWADGAEVLLRESGQLLHVSIDMDDVLMLMYTSGTTGRPKGAIWTHGNTLWYSAMQAMKFNFGPDTVALTTGPFYHAGAFEVFLLPALLRRGKAVAMSSGDFSIDRLIDVISESRVTDALLYPFMLYELLRHERCNREVLQSLRTIKSGGDPIMPWAIDALAQKLPGVQLVPTYGLTEGGGNVTYLDFEDLKGHRTSVGRPLPLTRVRVEKEDGALAEPNEVGEIVVTSPSVSQGYWEKPNETAATFGDGWCRTGDLGSISEDGYLTITGRKKDMIRSGGENIYPAEVESVLTDHPAIADAALVGVPDEKYLEVGCAVIVLDADQEATDEELTRYMKGQLASYKCPKYWVRVDDLPRNASGKVLKYELREEYEHLGKKPGSVSTGEGLR